MNVGLLTAGSVWGGTEVHGVALARTLVRRGHTATWVCLTKGALGACRGRVPEDLPVRCLDCPEPLDAIGFRRWLRIFAGQPWDACMLIKGDIHAGGGWAIDLAARRRFDRYLVLEQKNADPIGPRTSRRHLGLPGLGLWWYREQLRRYLRSIGPQRIVCVSELNGRQLVRDHRFPERKVVTVRNGIDTLRFRRDPAHAAAWRRRWDVPDDALVFGAVGRLAAIKGYDTALAAFQEVLRRLPDRDVRLVLVGEGPEEPALRARAGRIRPGGRVVFSPFCETPWEPLSAIDVFVMPSLNEGLPLALVEAMACGCCPVATEVGGNPEAVASPELGWCVPPGDASAFADALLAAAGRTRDERAAMARRAREHVLEHFDAETQLAALAEVIERA